MWLAGAYGEERPIFQKKVFYGSGERVQDGFEGQKKGRKGEKKRGLFLFRESVGSWEGGLEN